MEYLYRFRSTGALLKKYQELDKQEIYFSSLDQLNDPVEGFKDMFWSGDKIVWRNLLRHYLLCLEHVYTLFILDKSDAALESYNIPVFNTEEHFPTQKYKDLYKEICEKFFDNPIILKYPEFLASRKAPLRRNELLFYLRTFHYHAINSILTVHENHGHIKRAPDDPLRAFSSISLADPKTLDPLNNMEKLYSGVKDGSDQLYAIAYGLISQFDLVSQFKGIASYDSPNRKFVFLEFPEKYIKQLEKIVHPDWYTACFSKNCTNSSMWGYYGDSHKGVCLKFKTGPAQDAPYLKLNEIVGWGGSKKKSGPHYGEVEHRFHKINYAKQYPEIDFFRSLGRLPVPSLNWWYMDNQGNKSPCMEHVYGAESQWREKYWREFREGQTTKLEDWIYEEEYRLILAPIMIDYSNPNDRKLRYNFNALSGIIFGISTSLEDKFSIMKIIETKCNKQSNPNFKFFQAYYVKETGKIEAVEMPFVQLQSKT